MIEGISNTPLAATAPPRPILPPRATEPALGNAAQTGAAQSAAPATVTAATSSQPVDRATLEDATQKVQEFVSGMASELSFSIDDETGVQVVKITDKKTDEIIRQMPSEEMLAVAKALDTIKGLFIKNTA